MRPGNAPIWPLQASVNRVMVSRALKFGWARDSVSHLKTLLPVVRFGAVEWAFLLVALVAAAMRLWELDGRTMHYDEAIHLHFSWKLARGIEYVHSPWMHGPFQIELVAVVLKYLGDTDFLARLPYALFGVTLTVLPYFMRRLIGDKGAVCAAIILAFSPTLLYFSRFGRNDILMAVWALLLLIMLWQYGISSRKRYLFGAAIVTALMLATKETAYFVILFMGVAAMALGWRDILGFVKTRRGLAALNGSAGFFILMATLTLPQAAALIALAQSPLGLTIASRDTGSTGDTGSPVWETPFVTLPIWAAPVWLHIVAAAALVGLALVLAIGVWRIRGAIDLVSVGVAVLATVAAVCVVVVGPFHNLLGMQDAMGVGAAGAVVDFAAGAALLLLGIVALRLNLSSLVGWRGTMLLLGPAALLTWAWLILLWGGTEFISQLLPSAVSSEDVVAGRIAVNYLVPVLALLVLLVAGGTVGIAWGGGLWLGCAVVFYAIWTTLYTTMFTNWSGVFTGSWQSLGYWLMQQDVARGNQPWYYYFVGLSVYELAALIFGAVGVVWLIRRRATYGGIGVVLAVWVIATLALYTIAAEKMPWLLVNITAPLALVGGMFLGQVMDGINWGRLTRRAVATVLLGPIWLALAVWIAWLATTGYVNSFSIWLAVLILLPLAVAIAYLIRGHSQAGRAAVLGIAALLLLFGVAGAGRAAYTYDDSNVEILAYAQGSADLEQTYTQLQETALGEGAGDSSVKVDYDMWYPFQWYVRHESEAGSLRFDRFCSATNNGDNDSDDEKDDETRDCRAVGEDAGPLVYLAEHGHAVEEEDAPGYLKEGPMRNLLWYPETYRRPGEARTDTGFWKQLEADAAFFRGAAANPDKLRAALEYVLARRQESDWYSASYYQYARE